MTVILDVDGCTTKTQNHEQIGLLLKTKKKLLETKRLLKRKYNPSGDPNFTFTVTGRRGQFAPPAAAGRPEHRKNFR